MDRNNEQERKVKLSDAAVSQTQNAAPTKIRQKENEQQAVSLKDKVKMFTLNHTGTLRKAFAGMALLSSFSMGARGETEETSLNSIDNTKIKSLMPKNIWQNRLSFPAILIFRNQRLYSAGPVGKRQKRRLL